MNPLQKIYSAAKAKYPEVVLLFHVGNSYQLLGTDVGLVGTDTILIGGSSDALIKQLTLAGHKVAILSPAGQA